MMIDLEVSSRTCRLLVAAGIKPRRLIVAAVFLSICASTAYSGEPLAPATHKITQVDGYGAQVIDGFEVYIANNIDANQPGAGETALASLKKALVLAVRPLPPVVCDSLRSKVKLWVEYDNSMLLPGYNGNQIGGPAYIPRSKDVKVHERHEHKRGSVEISARVCLLGSWGSRMANTSPYWLLHELAHAHHDHNLGAMNQRIFSEYSMAVERKLYDAVEIRLVDENGKATTQITTGNARANHYEYFAELSVVYLATNHYYPFTRKELREHDPRGFELMEAIWQTKRR
jgi:hypothetical protein